MNVALRLSLFVTVAVWALKAAIGVATALASLWLVIAVLTWLLRKLRRGNGRW